MQRKVSWWLIHLMWTLDPEGCRDLQFSPKMGRHAHREEGDKHGCYFENRRKLWRPTAEGKMHFVSFLYDPVLFHSLRFWFWPLFYFWFCWYMIQNKTVHFDMERWKYHLSKGECNLRRFSGTWQAFVLEHSFTIQFLSLVTLVTCKLFNLEGIWQ